MPMICSDSQFLRWLHDRLTNVYKESPNTDWVQRLEKIIQQVKEIEDKVREDLDAKR